MTRQNACLAKQPLHSVPILYAQRPVALRYNHATMVISPVQGTPTELVTLQPYKLSPSFFAERMRGVSAEMSSDIYSRLQGIDVIDADGYCHWKKCDVPHSCW